MIDVLLACAVCFDPNEAKTARALLDMTVFLSLLPLGMSGAVHEDPGREHLLPEACGIDQGFAQALGHARQVGQPSAEAAVALGDQ